MFPLMSFNFGMSTSQDLALAKTCAESGHQQAVISSIVEYLQKNNLPGERGLDFHTDSAQVYDALQEIYRGGLNDEDLTTQAPTFYFYVAGGAKVEALP